MSELIEITKKEDLFAGNPWALILSDIHLGARGNYHPHLLEFLQILSTKLNNGELPSLQVVFVVGDFFDVLNESYRSLSRDSLFKAIYHEMNAILARNIPILMILGNHEISVLGDFTKHKTEFIQKFDKPLPYNGLTAENFAQFIIIETTADGKKTIKMFDNKSQMEKNQPFRTINLEGNGQTVVPKKYLLMHGHQFTPFATAMSGFLFWNPLLNASEAGKEAVDFLWDFSPADISDQELENKLKNWSQQKEPEQTAEVEALIKNNKAYAEAMKQQSKRSDKQRTKFVMNLMLPKIVKKVEKAKLGIDTLIFGHTHQAYTGTSKLKNNQTLQIVNPGGWQHVKSATYTTINTDVHTFSITYGDHLQLQETEDKGIKINKKKFQVLWWLGFFSMFWFMGIMAASMLTFQGGYQFWNLFLSDLGMDYAWNNELNEPGQTLFEIGCYSIAIMHIIFHLGMWSVVIQNMPEYKFESTFAKWFGFATGLVFALIAFFPKGHNDPVLNIHSIVANLYGFINFGLMIPWYLILARDDKTKRKLLLGLLPGLFYLLMVILFVAGPLINSDLGLDTNPYKPTIQKLIIIGFIWWFFTLLAWMYQKSKNLQN